MSRIAGILDRLHLHAASLESFPSLYAAIAQVRPHEVYHLASQSFVTQSFEDSFSTFRTNIDGTHYILESVRLAAPECKVYFAGSSEMFGNAPHSPQNEQTPFAPRSPYGVSKLTGFHLARNYREAFGMFVCSGNPFQSRVAAARVRVCHPQDHVSRGADQAGPCARAAAGQSRRPPRLGLRPRLRPRDVSHAAAAGARGPGRGHGRDSQRPRVLRSRLRQAGFGLSRICQAEPRRSIGPGEIHVLQGDATRAREKLGWRPTIDFQSLVEKMVEHDLAIARGD